MPAKKHTEANSEPDIEKAVNKPAVKAPEDAHQKLQAERRALESELAAIDGKLRDAISNGDLEALASLTARKLELPKLFIAASMAETNARNDLFNVEDAAIAARLDAGISERDKRQSHYLKRQRETEAELAELKEQWLEAEVTVGALYSEIAGSRNLGASCNDGFKKSLAALAGVGD